MGKSSSVTVGYKYFMGLHFAVCYGPVDSLRRIVVGERQAWSGNVTENETIEINAEDLFGGKKREGGIEGELDVMMGGPLQTANAYLSDKIEGLMPAFRGILSLVFKGGLVAANNPYVKPWAFQVTRIKKAWDGGEAWYPEKASTGIVSCQGSIAIYFAIDASGSMAAMTGNGETRMENLKTAIIGVIDALEEFHVSGGSRFDICLRAFASSFNNSSIVILDADGGDYDDLRSYIEGLEPDTAGGTSYRKAVEIVESFFDSADSEFGRYVIFCTDGIPAVNLPDTPQANTEDAAEMIFAVDGVSSFVFNIDLADTSFSGQLDNTPTDGVPVIDGGDPEAIENAILSALRSYEGMNPAHIIYQCLTDPMWGMGYPTAQIDSDSFEAAADTFHEEALGLCFIWNQQSSIEDFVQQVLDHAGAVYYADPKTGKFKLKALRNDYDPDELPIYDESSIISVDNFQRPGYGDTINEIVVVYRDQCTGKDSSIGVQDLANIQAQGGVVSQTRQYPGIPNPTLAARIGERDLVASSTPLAKCKITVNRKAWQQAPGDVIKVSWNKLGLEEVIFRVLTINYGTLEQGQLVIEMAEDVYGLPGSSYSVQEPGGVDEPSTAPQPVALQDVIETPYWDIARTLTAADLSFVDPDAAFIMAVAATENRIQLGFEMHTRISPNDYVSADGTGSFAPYAQLTSDGLLPTDLAINYEGGINISRVQIGQRAIIGTGRDAEFVEIVAVDSNGGYEVNRGILDTVPKAHPGGSTIFFNELDYAVDPTERATGESIDVKLTAFSGSGATSINAAVPMNIEPDQRFYRPYPPGKIRLNGENWPEEVAAELTVAWAHRDRVQQLVNYVSQEEDSIGPEAGTTYTVRYYSYGSLVHTESGISGAAAPEYVYALAGPGAIQVESVRDGVVSWQYQEREFTVLDPVTDTHADSVIALCHFEGGDGSTTITDVTGRVWTVYGNAQIDTAQDKFGDSSLLLDGTGDFLRADQIANSLAGVSDWTIEAFVRPAAVPGAIFAFNDVLGTNRLILATDAIVHPSGSDSFTPAMTTGAFVHAALVKSGINYKVFFDGVQMYSGTAGSAAIINSDFFCVGQEYDSSLVESDFLNGWIDDLRITKGVARYTAAFSPPGLTFDDDDVPPVAYIPAALLHFNGTDASTTLTDNTGRTWTANGNAQLDTAQTKFGSASLLLDGTGDYASTTSTTAMQASTDFTIECWIRPNFTSTLKCIVGKRPASGNSEFAIYAGATNKLTLNVWGTGGATSISITGTTNIQQSVWQHIMCCKKKTTWYVFLDGNLEGSATESNGYSTNSDALMIGRDNLNSARDWNGWIDEFRILKGVGLHDASFTPPAAEYVYP